MSIQTLIASFIFAIGCSVLPTQAQTPLTFDLKKYAQYQTVSNIFHEAYIQNTLKERLGAHYDAFMSKLENLANPVLMKNGTLLVSGWRGDPSAEILDSAAFVITPQGQLHAAFVEPDLNLVRYFSGDKNNYVMHPGLTVWFIPYRQNGLNIVILSEFNTPMIPWQWGSMPIPK